MRLPGHRWAARVLVVALAASTLGACDFDGAYDLPLPGSPVDDDHSYEVTAEFADILDVVPRSPVYVDDVTVGEVTDVERVGWHAKITMRVRDDVTLPDNAVAEIRQVSLLGEKYVALLPPSGRTAAGRLGDGDNIPLSSTGRNPEVEEVLAALSFLLSGGGVAQLGTITRELNAALDGRQDELRDLLGTLTDVVTTLDGQKADIISALESLNHLTATLNTEKDTIAGALEVAGPAITVLADQHDELVATLEALDQLGEVGTRVITASKDDLLASLDDLRPILSQLSSAGDRLAPGLNLLVSFPFPKEASDIVKGDYANTSIRADISLENVLPGGGLLPPVELPSVDDITACLTSASLSSPACTKVLASAGAIAQLRAACKQPANAQKVVCVVLNQVPSGTPTSGPGVPPVPVPVPTLPVPVPVVPSLPALPGLVGRGNPRTLTSSLTDSSPSRRTTMRGLMGGAS